MTDQFVKAPVKETGGIPVEEWVNITYDKATFNGDTILDVIDKYGDETKQPIKDACIVLNNIRWSRKKKLENNKSDTDMSVANNYGALTGNIVYKYYNHRETILDIMSNNNTNQLWVPLGLISDNENDKHVFFAAGRWAMSLGNNDISPNHEHVANMYMSVLQTFAYNIFTVTDYSKREWLINTFLYLTKAACRYFKVYPEAKKVVEPLTFSIEAFDMLQRTIAFLFVQDIPREDQYRIIEVAMKRMNKRSDLDMLKNSPGIFACLYLVPAIKSTIFDEENNKASNINQVIQTNTMNVIQGYIQDMKTRSLSEKDRNILILHKMLNIAFNDSPPTIEQVTLFYDFISDNKNHKIPAPLDKFGLIPKVNLPFSINIDRISNHERYNSCYTHVQKVIDNSIVIVGSSPTEWAGFKLLDGSYTFECKMIGNVTQAIGRTPGEEQKGIIRFTQGNDIFPTNYNSYSSAGVAGKPIRGKINFIECNKYIDLSKPFNVNIRNTIVRIIQDNILLYQYNLENMNMPTFAFKNIRIRIKKTESQTPVPTTVTANELVSSLIKKN